MSAKRKLDQEKSFRQNGKQIICLQNSKANICLWCALKRTRQLHRNWPQRENMPAADLFCQSHDYTGTVFQESYAVSLELAKVKKPLSDSEMVD